MIRFSEYVSPGHPAKVADYISESLLDAYIKQDPNTRFAVEIQIKDKYVTLGGEVSSNAVLGEEDIAQTARNAVNNIGYTKEYQDKWGVENTICGDSLVITSYSSSPPIYHNRVGRLPRGSTTRDGVTRVSSLGTPSQMTIPSACHWTIPLPSE